MFQPIVTTMRLKNGQSDIYIEFMNRNRKWVRLKNASTNSKLSFSSLTAAVAFLKMPSVQEQFRSIRFEEGIGSR
jgi:hypothetical protein